MFHKTIIIWGLLALLPSSGLTAQAALHQPEKARAIAQKMIDRDDGRSMYREVMLATCEYATGGESRRCVSRPIVKNIESLTLDLGPRLEDTISLGIIQDPPSEKNLAFLQHDYDEQGRESEQWMYFPALKKLKRIISQDENSPKTGSVFGSEIAYEDIEKMHLANYEYSYEGEEIVDGRACHKITAIPTKRHAPKTSYGSEVFWIDQETHIPLKRELHDKRSRLAKTYFCKSIISRNGVWLYKVRIVVNHLSRRMSMEKFGKIAVNVPLDKGLLGLRSLKDASFRESKMHPIRSKAE